MFSVKINIVAETQFTLFRVLLSITHLNSGTKLGSSNSLLGNMLLYHFMIFHLLFLFIPACIRDICVYIY